VIAEDPNQCGRWPQESVTTPPIQQPREQPDQSDHYWKPTEADHQGSTEAQERKGRYVTTFRPGDQLVVWWVDGRMVRARKK
jgi:hypothetical protein